MPVFDEYTRPKRAPDRVSDKVPWRGERWPFGVKLPSVQQERERLSTRITCAHTLESRPCRG